MPRSLPQLLLGLCALGGALVATGFVVSDATRDVKRTRDTIVVTGSAKQPIEADLASWSLAVSDQEFTPAAASRALRAKVARITAFLHAGGLPADEVHLPPVSVARTTVAIPTGKKRPAFRYVPAYRVGQRILVKTRDIDRIERIAGNVNKLLEQGVSVSVAPVEYVSTQLTEARFAALKKATADARRRAETIVAGLGSHLGGVRDAELGVYQVKPLNSTEVSDYGINDTSSRAKDVTAVVTVTFGVGG